MALIVEDGTGKVNAEAFCSVAQVTTYHAVRSTASAWVDLDLEVQEAALREATDYIQFTYAGQWSGDRKSDTQSLDWPRTGAEREDSLSGYWTDNTIPAPLVFATAELALKAATAGPLVSDLGRETISESVDVISVTYAKGGERQTQYEVADKWLQPLLDNGGAGASGVKIVRA
jgi:hypothetical protein